MNAEPTVDLASASTVAAPAGRAVAFPVHGRALGFGMLVASVLGGLISAYLALTHLQQGALVCTAGGAVDCGAVTSSSYSVIGSTGIPIAVLGVAWFAVSGALAAVALRKRPGAAWPVAAHFAWAALGLLYVMFLVWAEVVVIHRVCEWCTAVHLLVLVTFLAALRRLQLAA